jgi:hypothetical protein
VALGVAILTPIFPPTVNVLCEFRLPIFDIICGTLAQEVVEALNM